MGAFTEMACRACTEIEGPIQIVKGFLNIALQNVNILNHINILGSIVG